MQLRKAWGEIIIALAEFDYLTTLQIARLLYALSSLTHVQELMKSLGDASLVIILGGKALGLPRIYTLSGTGRQYAVGLGAMPRKRFRPSKEQAKARNPYFLKHTMAVTDVLLPPGCLPKLCRVLSSPACIQSGHSGGRSMWRCRRDAALSLMPVASFCSLRPGTQSRKHGSSSFISRYTAICHHRNCTSSTRSGGTRPPRQPASMKHSSQHRHGGCCVCPNADDGSNAQRWTEEALQDMH